MLKIGALFVTYQICKTIHPIKILNHQEKIQIGREIRDIVRNRTESDLRSENKHLRGRLDGVESTKKEVILNEPLLKIIIVKLKDLFS